MSRTLQFKRYANTVIAALTGSAGELILDTTNKTITVHDGSTVGGSRLATETFAVSQANAATSLAQAAFNSGNSTYVYANSAYYEANSAYLLSQSAYNQATIALNSATAAQGGLNSANANIVSLQVLANTRPQNAQSVSYVLANNDAGKHLYYTNTANVNLYIPWTSNTTWANGTNITIVSRSSPGTSNVTVTPNTGVSLFLAANSTSASRNVVSYGVARLIMVAANTWYIEGTGVY
jgi:hypothetical protein